MILKYFICIFLFFQFSIFSQNNAKPLLVTPVLKELSKIHEVLFSGSNDKIDTTELVKLLNKGGKTDEETKAMKLIIEPAKKIAKAISISEKQTLFAEMSDTISTIVNKENKIDMNVFYCPMVKKKWIGKGSKVQNPYASEMPGCGEIVVIQ